MFIGVEWIKSYGTVVFIQQLLILTLLKDMNKGAYK